MVLFGLIMGWLLMFIDQCFQKLTQANHLIWPPGYIADTASAGQALRVCRNFSLNAANFPP
jgi:hypothetical protein